MGSASPLHFYVSTFTCVIAFTKLVWSQAALLLFFHSLSLPIATYLPPVQPAARAPWVSASLWFPPRLCQLLYASVFQVLEPLEHDVDLGVTNFAWVPSSFPELVCHAKRVRNAVKVKIFVYSARLEDGACGVGSRTMSVTPCSIVSFLARVKVEAFHEQRHKTLLWPPILRAARL